MFKKIKFLAVMLFVMAVSVAHAQVTTSSMSGRVTDADGEVIGATVIAIHVPTGTRYGTSTNVEGRFSLTGMRVGGPYTVEVSFIGYGTHTTENITLQLGQEFVHNVFLTEDAQLLNELVVTGIRTRFTTERTGAATNISNRQITSMPTVNRSIQDIMRMSPFAGSGLSIAGADGRSTNFTVDGANFNNSMGLGGGILPGGGNPISLEALEEMQVVVAPFDVRQTNFIGGGINAVTRSGTNQLRGSAYMFHTNQELRGRRINDRFLPNDSEESTTIVGFSLGGPIIRDRLFFFVSAEQERMPGQVVHWRASEDGVINDALQLSRVRASDMQLVRDHLMRHYGYDTGSFTNFPGDETTRRLLARIDWNINQRHRLSLRYNHTSAERWFPPSASSSFLEQQVTPGARFSRYGMSFANSMYADNPIVNTFAGELNSRLTDRLSNQFLITYTNNLSPNRSTPSTPFPFIQILAGRNENGGAILNQSGINAGHEPFSWNNSAQSNVWTITNNFTAFLDNHRITAGVSYERQRVSNSFMPVGTGFYRFASLEEFLNRQAPVDVVLTYGFDGEERPAGVVIFNQIGAYVQDEWTISPTFRLTYGLRADLLVLEDNHMLTNPAIYELDFGGRRIDTGLMPQSRVQLSPRVGFTWDMMGDRSLILRGGTGLFAGRLPMVFLTNQPQNSQMIQMVSYGIITRYDADGNIIFSDPRLAQFEGGLVTNVQEIVQMLGLPTSPIGVVPPQINGTDPDFRMPQVWKSSLAVDIQLPTPFPMAVTVEGIFNNMINAVVLENWNLRQPDETWQRFAGPDNRFRYPPAQYRYYVRNVGPNNITPRALVLSNTNRGWGAIGNITVTASPVQNMNLMMAYTITESKELTAMPGNVANAIWNGTISVNGPHILDLQRSAHVIPHRLIGSFGYSTPSNTWAGNIFANTHFNIFYTGASSGGFSYLFNNNIIGDGVNNNLIWIPRERGDIRFINQEHEDAFFRFKAQCRYLRRNAGGYAEAHAVRAPWVHRFDLRVARDFRINRNTLTFSVDITNVGNMLNSSWGIPKNQALANAGRILHFENAAMVANGDNIPVFSVPAAILSEEATPWTTNYSIGNTWRMQFGVRYTFN